MKLQELHSFTKSALQKYPKLAWGMAFLYPALWLLMKTIPDITAAALLNRTPAMTSDLFFGHNRIWVIFVMFWSLLRFCILTPVLCLVCSWFSKLAGFRQSTGSVIRNTSFMLHCIRFFGETALLRFLALLPFMLSCLLTVSAFQQMSSAGSAGVWLFIMTQALAAAFWTGLYYLHFCAKLVVLPFLFLENRHISVFHAIHTAGDVLHHQYRRLCLIFLTSFSLPRMLAMLTVFLQIRIRECQQEKKKTENQKICL